MYVEHRPSPALAPFVACFWSRSAEPGEHRVLPDGCIDLLFSDGGLAIGTMSRPVVVASTRAYVAVRFKPGKAAAFLGFPARDITDGTVGIGELPHGRTLESEVADARTVPGQIAAIERYLLGHLPGDGDVYVDAVVAAIVRRNGDVPVAHLADFAGISRQHLARRFQHHVGLSPKAFARVVRFRAVLEGARDRPDWAQLARRLGYYDQAHLISDFREFSGVSPGVWEIGS